MGLERGVCVSVPSGTQLLPVAASGKAALVGPFRFGGVVIGREGGKKLVRVMLRTASSTYLADPAAARPILPHPALATLPSPRVPWVAVGSRGVTWGLCMLYLRLPLSSPLPSPRARRASV